MKNGARMKAVPTGINLGEETGGNIWSVSPDTTGASTAIERIIPITQNRRRDSTIREEDLQPLLLQESRLCYFKTESKRVDNFKDYQYPVDEFNNTEDDENNAWETENED